MTAKDALAQLKALGDEKVRKINYRNGAGDNQFGVKLGDIRKVAAKIKTDDKLAEALWKTGNLDAQLLAILILTPAKLSSERVDEMVRSVDCPQVADWLTSYVVKQHPDKEALRQAWMKDDHPWAARAGWALTSGRISKSPEGIDVPALLNRIEEEMASAPAAEQWTMNFALIDIGVYHPKLRKKAIAVGEKLGIYRDYPCAKGCVSPFAPIAIPEMARRRE